MSTSKDLSAYVARLEAKAIAKPAKAAALEAKLDAKIASLIAKGKTVVIDGVTVTSYNLDTSGSSGGGSSGGGSSSTTGTTYILDTKAEVSSSTANGDTYIALSAAGAGAATDTLTAADVIDGGAGNDTLSVTNTATTADATAGALISNIETMNIRNTAATTNATTLDATKISSLTSVNSNLGTGDLVVTGLKSGAAAGYIGNGSAVNGTLTFGYKAGVTAGTLNLAGGVVATNSAVVLDVDVGTSVASLTVNSTGATNKIKSLAMEDGGGTNTVTSVSINADSAVDFGTGITLFTGTAAKITASGAAENIAATTTAGPNGAVDLGTIENTTVATVDASGLTKGGITAVLNTNAAIKVTGGSGADYITTGAVLTTGSVNAGSGTDVLEIAAGGTHVATSALGAKYSGFETLRLNDSQDVSLVSGITALELNAMTSKTVSNITATQAANITVKGTQTTALTLSLADTSGSADSMSLRLASDTAATNVDVAGLSVAGVETLAISATTGTSGSASDVDFAASGADKLTTVTVTGSAETTLSGTNTSKAMTVNASALTGKFTASGNFVSKSTIVGSATAVNTFTVGTNEGSSYTGGAGNDVFNATAAQLASDGSTDTSLTGGSGTDTLNITGNGPTVTDNHFTNVTGMETLDFASATSVSLTTGGSFKTAFASGVTVTDDTIADGSTATFAMGLYDKNVTLTITTAGDGATTADNVSVTTGSGNDTVTVSAGSWVGTAGAAGALTVATGAGDDTITVSVGTLLKVTGAAPVQITGGTGKDIITVTAVEADTDAGTLSTTYVIAAGDSTTSAYDEIYGFDASGTNLQSQTLDFASVTLTAYAAAAATGYTAAELTVAVSAAGVVTFAGSSASGLTLAQKIAAVQSVVVTNAGDSAMFTHGSDTYVFNNNSSGDSLVRLVGITGTDLGTTNGDTASVGAGTIFIA